MEAKLGAGYMHAAVSGDETEPCGLVANWKSSEMNMTFSQHAQNTNTRE
jgi:hypothetical protein